MVMASTTASRGEFERQRGELLKEIAEVRPILPVRLDPHIERRRRRQREGEKKKRHNEADFLVLQSFEHVLANINKLNRNLEAVITVGNEFSSVEALWSTFENVMGKDETVEDDNTEACGRVQ